MLTKLTPIGAVLGLASACAGNVVFTHETPLLGRSLVANFDPSNATAVNEAKAAFPSVIEELFESGVLNKTDMSFTLDVFSAATNESIYTYTHIGENEEETLTSGQWDDETVVRIGSVSKLFTVYALIQKMGFDVLNDPVTEYLPELATPDDDAGWARIRFEELTVGALASHQGGTGGAVEVLLNNPDTFPTNLTAEQVFADMLASTKHATLAPYERALYSDGGFLLLTEIVKRVADKPTFGEAIQDILSQPLGLTGTSADAPEGDDLNVIDRRVIDALSTWGQNLPIAAGSGGVYSTRGDLRLIGLSILNSELLSAATTRHWMKPLGFTGSLVEGLGAPWEIARLTVPVSPESNRNRISDFYMKVGSNGDYSAVLGLSPDHGIGISVLVTGPLRLANNGRFILRDALVDSFIPAVEWAAVENAESNIVGTFVSNILPGTNLTLSFDDEGTGLVIESFYVDGADSLWILAGRAAPQAIDGTLRIYPTDVNSRSDSLSALYEAGFTGTVAHRMVIPIASGRRSAVEGGDGGRFDSNYAWTSIGFLGTLDEFILHFDEGRVVGVESLELLFER